MELDMLREAAGRRSLGESVRAIARSFGVAESTLRDNLNRFDRDGLVAPPHEVEDPVEIPVIRRHYDADHHLLYPLGDVHLGSQRHQSRRWQEWLDYLVANKNCSMLGTGDFLNAAIVGSKSDVYDETQTVGKAKRMLRRQLAPLAEDNRIDGLMPGNHEDRISRAVGDCPVEDVADVLEVPYVRASGVWLITVGDVEYRIYSRHGTGNGQSAAGLHKSALVVEGCDLYITSHVHRQIVAPDDVFRVEEGRCVRFHRYFVQSGSFLALENYAAQRGYAPTRIGAPRIFLDGRSRDVRVSV